MENLETNYSIIDWWKKVFLNNYANFKGRARRKEFWFFALSNIIIVIALSIISMIGLSIGGSILYSLVSVVLAIYYLATIIPSLAVAVRRLHDINKSGWFYFIALIPLIGSIILLVWFATDGDSFTNNYGEDPKNPGVPEFDFEKSTI